MRLKAPFWIGLLLTFAIGFAALASTISGNALFEFPDEPRWVVDAAGFRGSVVVKNVPNISSVEVEYTYPNSDTKSVTARSDAAVDGRYLFDVPAKPESGPGKFSYTVRVNAGSPAKSETRFIPLALEKELDITGDAAKPLFYPLGGPEYTVRYIPCCNIFGGVTIAARIPVNPELTEAGLPAERLSDFLVLKPDPLSASTMGMYFDFQFAPEFLKGKTSVLYEFDGKQWREYKDYKVDSAAGRISMHCPNGGTFILAAKQ